MKRIRQLQSIVAVTVVVLACLMTPAVVSADDHNPKVLPPQSRPFGLTYGEWGAQWWTWALTQAPEVNPVIDQTGEFCAQGQSGPVWYLAGTFVAGPDVQVTRNCTIPQNKPLFFPVLNSAWSTFIGDAQNCADAGYPSLEACALDVLKGIMDPWILDSQEGGISVTVDGRQVNLNFGPDQVTSPYRVVSHEFRMLLPLNNVSGVGEGTCPIVDDLVDCNPYFGDGIYLMLAPLSKGAHTVRIQVSGSFDITYLLTVKGEKDQRDVETNAASIIAGSQNLLFMPAVMTDN